MATETPAETPRRSIVAKGSEGVFGIRKKIEDEYQNATAKETIRTADFISVLMNLILPRLITKSITVALAPRATTKIKAFRPADPRSAPWNGVTGAAGTFWLEIG
jgi:hypothetical protein